MRKARSEKKRDKERKRGGRERKRGERPEERRKGSEVARKKKNREGNGEILILSKSITLNASATKSNHIN